MNYFKKIITFSLISGLVLGAAPVTAIAPKTEHEKFLSLSRGNFEQYVAQNHPDYSAEDKNNEVENILKYQQEVREQYENQKKAAFNPRTGTSRPVHGATKPLVYVPFKNNQHSPHAMQVCQTVLNPGQQPSGEQQNQQITIAQAPRSTVPAQTQNQQTNNVQQPVQQHAPTNSNAQQDVEAAQKFIAFSAEQGQAQMLAMQQGKQYTPPQLTPAQQQEVEQGMQAFVKLSPAQIDLIVQTMPIPAEHREQAKQQLIQTQQQIKAQVATVQPAGQAQAAERDQSEKQDANQENQNIEIAQAPQYLPATPRLTSAVGVDAALPFVMHILQEQARVAEHMKQYKEEEIQAGLFLQPEPLAMTVDQEKFLKKSCRAFVHLYDAEFTALIQKLGVPQEQQEQVKNMLEQIQAAERAKLETTLSPNTGKYLVQPAIEAFVAAPIANYLGIDRIKLILGGIGASMLAPLTQSNTVALAGKAISALGGSTTPDIIEPVQKLTKLNLPFAQFAYVISKTALADALDWTLSTVSDAVGMTKPLMNWFYGEEYVKLYEQAQQRDARAMMVYKEKLREYHAMPAYQTYKKAKQEHYDKLDKNPKYKGKKPRKPLENRPVKPKPTQLMPTGTVAQLQAAKGLALNFASAKIINVGVIAALAALAPATAVATAAAVATVSAT